MSLNHANIHILKLKRKQKECPEALQIMFYISKQFEIFRMDECRSYSQHSGKLHNDSTRTFDPDHNSFNTSKLHTNICIDVVTY